MSDDLDKQSIVLDDLETLLKKHGMTNIIKALITITHISKDEWVNKMYYGFKDALFNYEQRYDVNEDEQLEN